MDFVAKPQEAAAIRGIMNAEKSLEKAERMPYRGICSWFDIVCDIDNNQLLLVCVDDDAQVSMRARVTLKVLRNLLADAERASRAMALARRAGFARPIDEPQ